MFCNKCGKQIEDDAGFCPFCGKEVEYSLEKKPKQYNVRQERNTRKTVRKPVRTNYKIAVLIILVSVIIGGIVLVFILKGKSDNTKDKENTKSQTLAESTDSDIESVEPDEEDTPLADEKTDTDSQEDETSNQKKSYRYADTPDEAFTNYMSVFTNAVNTGNYSNANSVLLEGSPLYNEQKDVVNKIYGEGITEQVESFSIKSTEEISSTKVRIISDEKIKLFYKDGTSKNLSQSYGYICELADDGWLFTNIEAVQ